MALSQSFLSAHSNYELDAHSRVFLSQSVHVVECHGWSGVARHNVQLVPSLQSWLNEHLSEKLTCQNRAVHSTPGVTEISFLVLSGGGLSLD